MKLTTIYSLLIAFCCMVFSADAQVMNMHFAYDQSTISNILPGLLQPKTLPIRSYLLSSPAARTSYGGGFGVRFGYADFKPVYVHAELTGFYQNHTFQVRDSSTNNLLFSYTKERYRLDVPLMAGVKLGWFRGMAGVVPRLAIPEDGSHKQFNTWWTEMFNTGNVGYTYGVGVDLFDFVNLDVRVQSDFGQRVEATYVSDLGVGGRHYFINNAFMVKLGFRISKETE
jgi:hypothetical protein